MVVHLRSYHEQKAQPVPQGFGIVAVEAVGHLCAEALVIRRHVGRCVIVGWQRGAVYEGGERGLVGTREQELGRAVRAACMQVALVDGLGVDVGCRVAFGEPVAQRA